MAKKSNSKQPLKKLHKKYALAGFNSGSVAMSRQNPYYLGQVEEEQAKADFANATEEAAYAAKMAKQKKKQEEEMLKQQKKDAMQSSFTSIAKGAAADQKAGNFGKFLLKNPTTPVAGVNAMTEVGANAVNTTGPTTWAPVGSLPTAASVGQGGQMVNPVFTNAGGSPATQMVVGQTAPTMSTVGGAPATGAANVASTGTAAAGSSTGGLLTANMSGLATAGVGAALTGIGMVTERKTDDKRASTSTQQERTGNTVGEGFKGAGAGFAYGAMAGSVLPGIGNVAGGIVGGLVGAGIGIYKGVKENKAAKGEAKDIQRQDRMTRAAYLAALESSRASTMNKGFGYNTSTNMGNDNTTAYGQNMGTQYAKTGGVKRVPGGKIVPMGKNAVKFLGRKHEEGGIDLDDYTEVEDKETMQKNMKMKNGKKNDYFFSSFLKIGKKTFAQKHEEILKSGLPKRVITAKLQDLAKLQEQAAGRNPDEVAEGEKAYRLGGQMLFKKGGANDKPSACPEGYVLETSLTGAKGTCVPKEWKEKEQNLSDKLAKKYGDRWWDLEDANHDKAWEEYSKEYDAISREVFGEDHDNPFSASYELNAKGTEGEKIAPSKGDRNKFANKEQAAPSNQETLSNILDNVGPGGIEEGVYTKKEAEAQNNAANQVADDTEESDFVREQFLGRGYVEDGKGGFVVPEGMILNDAGYVVDPATNAEDDKRWRDYWSSQGYVFNEAGERVLPPGKKLVVYDDGSEKIVDENDQSTPADNAELKKWNGNKEAYDAFQDAKQKIMADPDLRKDLAAQYKKVIEDQASYTGKKSSTKSAFKTKYYDELSKMGEEDIINELLAQEERNARMAAFGFDPAKSSQNAGARGGTTNKEADEFAAAHPELADLDWSGGHKGQAAYIAYNQLMNTDKYQGYAANQTGVNDEVFGTVSGIDRFSTNTTLGQRLNYKGKSTPPPPPSITPPKNDCPPGTTWNEATKTCDPTVPKREPCPPGHYLDDQGNCVKLEDWKPKDEMRLPGLLQLVPVGYAMLNPYQKDKGIPGSPGITGPLMPRVNLNQERASAVSSQVALNTAIQNQNMGPGAISAMIATAGKTNEQMLKIAKQEQDSNKQLAAEEAKLGMQASMFNVENEQKRQMANADLRIGEKKYKREEMLGTLDAASTRITGIIKDERMFKANERLAKAMDETGSYDRFTLYEQLQKEAKNKRSPMYGKNETELRNMAAGYSKLFYGDRGIVADQFNGQAQGQQQQQQKLGGARQYTSRLGELTKRPKLRIK